MTREDDLKMKYNDIMFYRTQLKTVIGETQQPGSEHFI